MPKYHATDGRIRGYRGVALRAKIRREEPLCRHCLAIGRATATTQIDHIVPLSMGGSNGRENLQGLCDGCHDIKTAKESASGYGASTHPAWLEPSAIPLTIVCGPPCSGKTTYIAGRAEPDDIVIDIDTIARDLSPAYIHWSGMMTSDLLSRSIRVRNALLGTLARSTRRRAWLIVSAPTQEEREWWRLKLCGDVVLLDPGPAECKRRATARGTPLAAKGIDEWYAKAKRPWRRPRAPRVIGVDGWPVSD